MYNENAFILNGTVFILTLVKRFFRCVCKSFFLIGVVSLSACQGAKSEPEQPAAAVEPEQSASAVEPLVMLQLAPLVKGEELAVMHTSMGDIKLRFFPEQAPLAVENFITHAKEGYYDGVTFHRVINDFMLQGGDPDGTGMGGESIWGKGFGVEFSAGLRHFRGALSMAHSSARDSNGSQFFIVQNTNLNEKYKQFFESMYAKQDEAIATTDDEQPIYGKQIFPTAMLDEYINNGGTPHLDLVMNENGHTVFGHVVEGMDVVDAIAEVEVNSSDKPLRDVVIKSITFEIYQ